jgi:hypothetical protein
MNLNNIRFKIVDNLTMSVTDSFRSGWSIPFGNSFKLTTYVNSELSETPFVELPYTIQEIVETNAL